MMHDPHQTLTFTYRCTYTITHLPVPLPLRSKVAYNYDLATHLSKKPCYNDFQGVGDRERCQGPIFVLRASKWDQAEGGGSKTQRELESLRILHSA
eukprot:1351451-Amorphochlora_amoeboformis.AAC.1